MKLIDRKFKKIVDEFESAIQAHERNLKEIGYKEVSYYQGMISGLAHAKGVVETIWKSKRLFKEIK